MNVLLLQSAFPAFFALSAAADDMQHPKSVNAANETLQILQYPLASQAAAGNLAAGVPHNRSSKVGSDVSLIVSEKKAQYVSVPFSIWHAALSEMHDNHVADRDNYARQIVSEKAALKVYGGSVHDKDGNPAPALWRVALNEMHDKHAGGQSPAAKIWESTSQSDDKPNLHGSMHNTAEGRVRYMEYFADTAAMEDELGKLAAKANASILRTNPVVFGKTIRKYLVETLLAPDAVIATCHNPKDCTVSADLSKCDSRFMDPANFLNVNVSASRKVAALRGNIPASQPICHSPPTSTDMVYTLVEFEDHSQDWLMWACHRHNLKSMLCHVTDVVVVDGQALRAAAGGLH